MAEQNGARLLLDADEAADLLGLTKRQVITLAHARSRSRTFASADT